MNKLSICFTVKNRSKIANREIFPQTIKSIVEHSSPGEPIEVVVSDWLSTDWPLVEWIYDYAKHVPIKVVNIDQCGFNRGIGLNLSAQNSSGNILFFNDADILVDRATLDLAFRCITDKIAFFPRVRKTTSYGHLIVREDKRWLRGFGVAIVLREWWERAGLYKSFWYTADNWGGEDNQFHDDIKTLNIKIERPKMDNLVHQWHPRKVIYEQL
jgi:glycosyltransferase involved in cell wall biosynthesis